MMRGPRLLFPSYFQQYTGTYTSYKGEITTARTKFDRLDTSLGVSVACATVGISKPPLDLTVLYKRHALQEKKEHWKTTLVAREVI